MIPSTDAVRRPAPADRSPDRCRFERERPATRAAARNEAGSRRAAPARHPRLRRPAQPSERAARELFLERTELPAGVPEAVAPTPTPGRDGAKRLARSWHRAPPCDPNARLARLARVARRRPRPCARRYRYRARVQHSLAPMPEAQAAACAFGPRRRRLHPLRKRRALRRDSCRYPPSHTATQHPGTALSYPIAQRIEDGLRRSRAPGGAVAQALPPRAQPA